jgi:indole-3-glycerol phosphate synthase/phosphoribosylanthranilate isomerase
VLDEILAWKRGEIETRRLATPLESLLARCSRADRSLGAALGGRAPGFILELKRASPSAGRLVRDEDAATLLRAYAPHADAISIVTDARFFEGRRDDLRLARSLTRVPILCKDFVVDAWQVAEARLHGADAVLQILDAIDDATWRACAALAARLGMDVVSEAHDPREVDRAVGLGAHLIGINSRDLRTMRVDLGAVRGAAARVPADRLAIAESGIRSRGDVESLSACADAFLVGTSLLRAKDRDAAIRQLVYGMTKVCGLTRPEDARLAWEAGATHGGLILAAGSPRSLTAAQAAAIRAAAPLQWVGVFADQSPDLIADAARALSLAAVQLHGEESAVEVADLRRRLPGGCAIWKAVRIAAAIPKSLDTGADRLLLEPRVEGRRGGTGRRFDWALLDGRHDRRDWILAGGIDAGNVARAAATGVAGLDVCSGVEEAPGRKDARRLRAFFAARRILPGRRASGIVSPASSEVR